MPVSVKCFNTHYEVSPYRQGMCRVIENMFSKYDPKIHKRIPVGYFIQDSTLYLPRGADANKLAYYFRTTITPMGIPDPMSAPKSPFYMKTPPRDSVQEDSINFLLCRNEFSRGNYYRQFGLNLNTGEGKTYCTISAISILRKKAVIITHKTSLRDQWKDAFLEHSTIDESRIIPIQGSRGMENILARTTEGDVYIVTHQTISSYAKTHGWTSVHDVFKVMQVGIKVIDEAHLHFSNTLMVDFFTNTERTYYLTATPDRNDPLEVPIFRRAFANMYRYGEDISGRRKHVVFIPVSYRSRPDIYQIDQICNGTRGFNAKKFIDYALTYDDNRSMEKVLRRVIEKVDGLDGKILITTPKLNTFEHIKKIAESVSTRSIGFVNSEQSRQINNDSRQSDIIISTISGTGVGDDIHNLRVIINLEPIASSGRIDQLKGRLREFNEIDDTYMFHLVDEGFPKIGDMCRHIEPVMIKKCKEVRKMILEV